MFHVSQGSAGLETSICMFQSFHPDSLGGFQILLPAPAQMFQDSRESWHRCVIYYEVLSPLASALQVFGSMNVMEKGSIWRKAWNPFKFLWLFVYLFVCFLKEKGKTLFCHCNTHLTHQVIQVKEHCNRDIPRNGRCPVSVGGKRASKQEWKLAGGARKGQKFPAQRHSERGSQ